MMSQARTTITTAFITVATAMAASTVAGCSGDTKAAPTTPSVSKSSTAPPVTTSKPVITASTDAYTGPASVPLAARAHTDAGRIAFARHYIDEINRTNQTPTTGVLELLSMPSCKSCANYISTVASLKKNGERFVGDSYTVDSVKFPERMNHNILQIISHGPAVKQVSASGAILKIYPAENRVAIAIFLKWDTLWRVEEIKNDITVGQNG